MRSWFPLVWFGAPGNSIARRGFVLVSFPLALWLLLLSLLLAVYIASERARIQESRLSSLIELSLSMGFEIRDLMATTLVYRAGMKEHFTSSPILLTSLRERIDELRQSIQQKFDRLDLSNSSTTTNSSTRALWLDVKQNLDRLLHYCSCLVIALDDANSLEHEVIPQNSDCEKLLYNMSSAVFQPWPTLIKAQRADQEKVQRSSKILRITFLVLLSAGVLINSVLAIFLFRSFTRDVARRLSELAKNSIRILNDPVLRPPQEGDDEIAHLDRILVDVTRELREQTTRERAIVDHARDMIFVLSDDLTVLIANPTVGQLLGRELQDLHGTSFRELLTPHSQDQCDLVRSASQIEDSSEFECEFLTNENRIVVTQSSMSRGNDGCNLIVIARDVSEVRALEQARQEFVNIVSHDIRTPLTSMSLSLDMLQTGLTGNLDSSSLETVEKSSSNLKYVLDLVNDLLDIAKIDSGMLRLEKQEFDSQVPVAEVVRICGPLAIKKQITICSDCVQSVPMYADLGRITQVVQNLLSNAIKFAPDGTLIQISCEADIDAVKYEIRDQGPGVDTASTKHLFDRFWQLKQSDASKGTGLGLSICKMIIEEHNGKIGFTPNPQGGSIFWFSVPLARETDVIAN